MLLYNNLSLITKKGESMTRLFFVKNNLEND